MRKTNYSNRYRFNFVLWSHNTDLSVFTLQDTNLPAVMELEDSQANDEVKENVRVSVQRFLQVKGINAV